MSNMAALFWMIVAYHWRKIQKPKNTDLSINQKVTKSYRQQQLIMSANQILQPTMQIEILTRYRLAHYSCFANHDYQLFINCEELRFQKTNTWQVTFCWIQCWPPNQKRTIPAFIFSQNWDLEGCSFHLLLEFFLLTQSSELGIQRLGCC